ncbi:MAG TPA: hypothetical protein VLT45_19115 [Kofleriaceae bacterium]|nr:hypothetical protein [Kofleriaceae bacterium]
MSDFDDTIKKAGSFFSKLGSQVKSTAKHVTGVGRGDIKLELDVPKAPPGGTLRGRIVLQLAEPTDAKRLVVSLRATRRQRQAGSTNPVSVEMYKLDHEVAGAQRYEITSYPFELTVPADALELKPSASHPLLDVVKAFAPTGPVEWQVVARLEIPWGKDFTSSVDVTVTR